MREGCVGSYAIGSETQECGDKKIGQTDKQWNEEVKIQTHSGTGRQTGEWECNNRGRDKESAVGIRGWGHTVY